MCRPPTTRPREGVSGLTLDLRDLDARVERVELATRELISAKLDDYPDQVPQHIQ